MPGWNFLYRIADCTFALEGSGATLKALAESLYSAARAEEGSPQMRFVLRRRREYFALLQEGAEITCAPGRAPFFQAVEWSLTEAVMGRLQHFFQVHAGAVAWEGRTLLLSGPPEAGKTSLVLALAAAGGAILGDEIALVSAPDLRLVPFRRDLIVHRDTQALFPRLAEARLEPWKAFPEYSYISPRELGAPPPGPVAPGVLVFPLRRPGAALEVRPVGQAEAARRLLGQCFNLGDWGSEGTEVVGRLVEQAPALELVFADARRAAAQLADSLESES